MDGIGVAQLGDVAVWLTYVAAPLFLVVLVFILLWMIYELPRRIAEFISELVVIERIPKPRGSDKAQATANQLALQQIALLETIAQHVTTPVQPMENGKFTIYQYEKGETEVRSRISPKVIMVCDWLKANPDKAELSNREIAKLLGVSHPTVATARITNIEAIASEGK